MFKIVATFLFFITFTAGAQDPELRGGLAAFLKKNMVYPPYSLQHCIQGRVNVGFKLNAKGKVYEAVITKGMGTDLDDEALRLIRLSSGKWNVPAKHDTLSLIVVPVNFAISSDDCSRQSPNDIALAIKAYKDEAELTNVIVNFYKNKEDGMYRPEDEVKINQVKKELGIDDDYLQRRIDTALKKYKQGDRKGACDDFNFIKYMGSAKGAELLAKYCK